MFAPFPMCGDDGGTKSASSLARTCSASSKKFSKKSADASVARDADAFAATAASATTVAAANAGTAADAALPDAPDRTMAAHAELAVAGLADASSAKKLADASPGAASAATAAEAALTSSEPAAHSRGEHGCICSGGPYIPYRDVSQRASQGLFAHRCNLRISPIFK